MSDDEDEDIHDSSADFHTCQEIRTALLEPALRIHWDIGYNGIFAHVDSFMDISQGNTAVRKVFLDLFWQENSIRLTDEDWETKLGKALGNLQSLQELYIQYPESYRGVEIEPPDWETFALVLRHVRQKITLHVCIFPTGASEEALAAAIFRNDNIQGFVSAFCYHVPFFDVLLPALATLPALESIRLKCSSLTDRDLQDLETLPPALQHAQDMNILLTLSPCLRSISFQFFYFQEPVYQAVVSALETGSSPITRLDLINCKFQNSNDCSPIVQSLEWNSTLKTLGLHVDVCDERLSLALTNVLLHNTTLEDMTVHCSERITSEHYSWLDPFLRALQFNTSLKHVSVQSFSLLDEPACQALRQVLADHSSLECLEMQTRDSISSDYYLSIMNVIAKNNTLKTLRIALDIRASFSEHDDCWMRDLILIVQKNYSLECLHDNYRHEEEIIGFDSRISSHDKTGELDTILQLNRAGRRYLIQEGPECITKGVEVLVAVRDNIGCLFYHLLENPTLCDIEHRD
jgi:hypothetical protein